MLKRPFHILRKLRRVLRGRLPPKPAKAAALPRRTSNSPTFYKDDVPKENFSFTKEKGWVYVDRQECINPMKRIYYGANHLILRDRNGAARFTLAYGVLPSGQLLVTSVQRERTKAGYAIGFYSGKKETKASKRFREELGGMHPDDFLFSEFLRMHAAEISPERPVLLSYEISAGDKRNEVRGNYASLIDKFFKRAPKKDPKRGRVYELSFDRERVRKIFGLH